MALKKLRNVRIGIVYNCVDKEDTIEMKSQYITSSQISTDLTQALESNGAEVVHIQANGDLFKKLSEISGEIDLIFNLAHVLYQVAVPMTVEQLHLELDDMQLECTGSKAEGHLLALNKMIARRVLGDRVLQPEWWSFSDTESPQLDSITFPVLVKPIGEAYSVGVSPENVVFSIGDLNQSLNKLKKRIGGTMLVESFLDGEEYSMGIIGDVVMPAVAWDLDKLPGKPIVRGEKLKQNDSTLPYATLVREPELATLLATQTIIAHNGLGLQDYSRSDFRSKRNAPDKPCYLETNSGPGLENLHSVLPWSAAKSGVNYQDLIGSIVAQTLHRLPENYLQQLDTTGFEKAYGRLHDRAKSGRKIIVNEREYYLLEPID